MNEYNKLLISKAPEMLELIGRLVACKSRSFDELQIIGEIELFYSNFEQQINELNQWEQKHK